MKRRVLIKMYLVAIISVLLLIITSAGFVYAYLSYVAPDIKNTVKVDSQPIITIKETVSGKEKSDVYIANENDYAIYVRASIVVNWKEDENGNTHGVPPVLDTDYTLDLNLNDWIYINGFYYYKNPITANAKTSNLINHCEMINLSNDTDLVLSVEIVAQAIQALGNAGGKLPVEESWNVNVENGVIVGTNNN